MLQVIEIQLPSFFNNFDPRAAAANFPSGNISGFGGSTVIEIKFLVDEY